MLLRRIGIPPPTVAPWRVRCIKTGSQIGGWVFSSLDHVIRGGPKYTISLPSGRGMSIDYKSVFRLVISCSILEQWTGEVGDRLKIDRNWGFSGPQILMGVSPQISDQVCKITPISDLLS